MNNILVLPVVIPVLAGILLVFFRSHIQIQRWLSLAAILSVTGISIYILNMIQNAGIIRLDFGNWQPPFGILLSVIPSPCYWC